MPRPLWSAPMLALAVAAAAGCEKPPAGPPPAPPPEVDVSTPVRGTVADYEVFTGRTQAFNAADLRCRVSGYVEKVLFQEGDDVEAGAPLFQLQLKPFEVALEQAKGNLAQQEAQLVYNEANYKRLSGLTNQGSISQNEIQSALSARDVSVGAVAAAKAALDIAKQNVDWATVRAPFAGRISRRMVDPGNTVTADTTILASLVQLDPLYAYFDVDERTLLRIRSRLVGGKATADPEHAPSVALGLSDERPEAFSRAGVLKFADNKVDPNTGTLRMWGTFDNTKRDLFPGLFVRIRLGVGEPRPALLVSEAALGSDQGRKFLYAVDAENKVARVPVEVGRRTDGLIAVEKGLTGAERVIVRGLQNVRPKADVVPKVVDMPRATARSGPPAGGGKPPVGDTKPPAATPTGPVADRPGAPPAGRPAGPKAKGGPPAGS